MSTLRFDCSAKSSIPTIPPARLGLEQRYREVGAQRQYADQPRRGELVEHTPPFNPPNSVLLSTATFDGLELASHLRW